MCSKCEAVGDLSVDCEQCGKRVHTFWKYHVGKFIPYLRQSRTFVDKVYIISHKTHGYYSQFHFRSFLELTWAVQLITDASKILSMVVENLHFPDPLKYFPIILMNTHKSFEPPCKKWYSPHSSTMLKF